jgi:hypothetical protein
MKTISKKEAREGARCAWGGKLHPGVGGVYLLVAKLHAGVSLAEGMIYPMKMSNGKVVRAIVCTDDSPMKADGWDCGFPLCSERCGNLLTTALRQDGVLLESQLN